MTERKYKRTAYGSTPYAFRLSGKTEDQYRKQLDLWIGETMNNDIELSPSQALKNVVKGLIELHTGHSLGTMADSEPIDVKALKQAITEDLKEWLVNQFATPEKAAHLAHVSSIAAKGGSIADDVIDNILEDFGR